MIIICPNSRILWIPLYFLLEEKKKDFGPNELMCISRCQCLFWNAVKIWMLIYRQDELKVGEDEKKEVDRKEEGAMMLGVSWV